MGWTCSRPDLMTVQRGMMELDYSLEESFIEWKKTGLLQLPGLAIGQKPAQEECDLYLKAEVDTGGPKS